MSELEALAESWIKLQHIGINSLGAKELDWTILALTELLHEDPEGLWELIIKILEIDDSELVCKSVGAGYLEDLLLNYPNQFLDRVNAKIASSHAFKVALASVWVDKDELDNDKLFLLIEKCKSE